MFVDKETGEVHGHHKSIDEFMNSVQSQVTPSEKILALAYDTPLTVDFSVELAPGVWIKAITVMSINARSGNPDIYDEKTGLNYLPESLVKAFCKLQLSAIIASLWDTLLDKAKNWELNSVLGNDMWPEAVGGGIQVPVTRDNKMAYLVKGVTKEELNRVTVNSVKILEK